MLLQAKQISKLLATTVAVAAFAMPAAATADVTAAISASLATAANDGTAVPVQVASPTQEGLVTTGSNKVEVSDDATGAKIFFEDGANDREVYGRLVEAGGVYSLELYYTDGAGVETSFVPAAVTNITFEFPYQFTFNQLPSDAMIRTQTYHLDDTSGGGLNMVQEQVAVTALDTLAATTQAYVGVGPVLLFVNGKQERFTGATPAFTMAGTAITWSAANAGYPLATTDEVIVAYAV